MLSKKIGTDFEKRMCKELSDRGFWVHFITPDRSGRQPFDIIAIKHGIPFAIECKTSAKKTFPITRLEDDQITAFNKWINCGNGNPMVAVEYDGHIYMIPFTVLNKKQKINLETDDEIYCWE